MKKTSEVLNTTDAVVFRVKGGKLEVLVIQRKEAPYNQMYALPGGLLNPEEELDENIRRHLRAKSGLACEHLYMEQLYTKGDIGRDPRGRVVSTIYLGLVTPQSETEETRDTWLGVDEIQKGIQPLAFDHAEIVSNARQRLCGKLDYTNIGINLVSEEFIIAELQGVYEAVGGRKLNNFRRKVAEYIEPTGKQQGGKQNRPAQLYRKR